MASFSQARWQVDADWRSHREISAATMADGGASLGGSSVPSRGGSRRRTNWPSVPVASAPRSADKNGAVINRSLRLSHSTRLKTPAFRSWDKPRHRQIHPNFISPPRSERTVSNSSCENTGESAHEDPDTTKAIAEGRRIYVGNLLYSAKPEDIEGLLMRCNLSYERIHISIDPFTGRNPSYCFIEFGHKNVSDAAMQKLNGQELLGREVKCGPCVPKARPERGETFRRWGDWKGSNPPPSPRTTGVDYNPGDRDFEIVEDGGASLASPQAIISTGGPYEALKHWEGMADAKRRLYVGGLPRMADQRTCDSAVRKLFVDFQVEAVSKAISPYNKENRESGSKAHANSYYCFVDFPTAEEARLAAEKVNGMRMFGGRLRVAHAKGDSKKWREREMLPGWNGNQVVREARGEENY